jgi:hypothetical protein
MSALLKKTLVQSSQMNCARDHAPRTRGFSTSDANQAALVTALSNILTTADSKMPLQVDRGP